MESLTGHPALAWQDSDWVEAVEHEDRDVLS